MNSCDSSIYLIIENIFNTLRTIGESFNIYGTHLVIPIFLVSVFSDLHFVAIIRTDL